MPGVDSYGKHFREGMPLIPRIIDALERQADKGLLELLDSRAKIKVLEASNRDLQTQNEALRRQLDELKAEARHSQVTAGRSQGLAALMARRPRQHATAEEASNATDNAADSVGASAVKPERASAPVHATPSPARQVTDVSSGGEPVNGDEHGPQGRLSIDDAPSPQVLLDEWYRRYTDTFFKGHTRPLKVGIHEDLVAREPWPEKLVRRALACYVHLPRYLKAVRAGAERVGLDGESAGTVTEGEAKYARKQLDDLQAQNRTRQARRREKERQQEKESRLEQKISELLAKHDH